MLTPEQLQQRAALAAGVTRWQLLAARDPAILAARDACMLQVWRTCGHLTMAAIGNEFGGIGPSTVSKAIKRAEIANANG